MKRLIAALLPLFALATAPASASDKAGDVVRLRGAATIERADATLQARVRSELMREDEIRTRERTRMKMLFLDDSVLTLGPNSRLRVQQHLAGKHGRPARSLYHLADGKMKAVVGRPGFSVRTPTAFAAARGTVFRLWYDSASDSTGVEVLEGSVEVSNVREEISGSQVVLAGQFTVVPRDGPPAPPQASSRRPGAGAADEGDDGGPALAELPEGMGMESLRDSFEDLLAGVPPIEQEPELSSRVSLNLQFRFP